MAQDIGIFERLKKEHTELRSLLDDLVDSDDEETRAELFPRIRVELLTHAEAEEATFYADLCEHDATAEKATHSIEEHGEAEELLERLADMPYDDEDWMEAFEELREAVLHHVHEEEHELFPKAQKALGAERARSLLGEFLEARESAEERLGAYEEDEELEDLTKDELYERARQAGIDGRSSMTKRELIRGIRAH